MKYLKFKKDYLVYSKGEMLCVEKSNLDRLVAIDVAEEIKKDEFDKANNAKIVAKLKALKEAKKSDCSGDCDEFADCESCKEAAKKKAKKIRVK